MSEVRTGLFWGSVIQEMPKLQYDKHYGIYNIFPFFFSWLSLLMAPCIVFIKDKSYLEKINSVCFHIVYFPLSLVLLALFMAVNAVLLPIAYFKTIIHKIILL